MQSKRTDCNDRSISKPARRPDCDTVDPGDDVRHFRRFDARSHSDDGSGVDHPPFLPTRAGSCFGDGNRRQLHRYFCG